MFAQEFNDLKKMEVKFEVMNTYVFCSFMRILYGIILCRVGVYVMAWFALS